MNIKDAADYAGTGAAATLASILGLSTVNPAAKWFQITTVSGTFSTLPRVGSSAITTARGIPVSSGQFAPPVAEETSLYMLDQIYLLVAIGDTVSVAYAI